MKTARSRNGNGTIKWAGIALTVAVVIAGVALYVSNVKAAADYNRIEIDALKQEQKEILQMLHKIDRTVVAIRTKLGIHKEKRK